MNNEQIKTFIRGGKATFTLESIKTGKHYTFRANKVEKDDGGAVIFVSLLTAPEEYNYLGTIFVDADGGMVYRATAKSPDNPKLHAVVKFLLGNLNFDTDMESRGMIFRHEGTCCRCGRPLTTPESIDAGIGPVCREKM